MVFCGENVVSLWFFVVILGVVFRALKNVTLLKIFLWIFLVTAGGANPGGRWGTEGRVTIGVDHGCSSKALECMLLALLGEFPS
jgi:hypothetical protein